ncbi:hypothetical protein GCM10009765_79670 [Fodinicola feengrottensis]|uniref:Uncharacterized protein n=1 Tax=Fodinicola feengrottensis TaxID=435914 RepID=A0ABN2J757_9ACTN
MDAVRTVRRPLVVDAALAVVLAGGSLALANVSFLGDKALVLFGADRVPAVLGWWIATAVALAALPCRRSYPVLVFWSTVAMAIYHMSWGWGCCLPTPPC